MTMKLFEQRCGCSAGGGGNGAEDTAGDARAVARQLGIRHYLVNYSTEFKERVMKPFVTNYVNGLTPSPCILCNSLLKFSKLKHFAKCLGVDYAATGHYSTIQYDDITRRYLLCKGRDRQKDQSYFLFQLTQDQLRNTLFPLGDLTKGEIRKLAQEIGLVVADKEESQEVCFIPDGDYRGFIDDYLHEHPDAVRPQPGDIVSTDGTILGQHEGIHHFTIGQRRGLGLALGEPLYVVAIDAYRHRVVVGTKTDVFARRFFVTCTNWIATSSLEEEIEVEVKIRSRSEPSSARIKPWSQRGAVIEFKEPQAAITPGQGAVFYWDDVVVGGGWIYKVEAE